VLDDLTEAEIEQIDQALDDRADLLYDMDADEELQVVEDVLARFREVTDE
jgi:hypothetical protein